MRPHGDVSVWAPDPIDGMEYGAKGGKSHMDVRSEEMPATARQLAGAMQALGAYSGENSEVEHNAEAQRVGSATYYRALLANALLGLVEVEALHADGVGLAADQMRGAHRQALATAGVEE